MLITNFTLIICYPPLCKYSSPSRQKKIQKISQIRIVFTDPAWIIFFSVPFLLLIFTVKQFTYNSPSFKIRTVPSQRKFVDSSRPYYFLAHAIYVLIKLHLFAVVVLAFGEGCTERVRTCRNGNRPVNSPDYFPILFSSFLLFCFTLLFYFLFSR